MAEVSLPHKTTQQMQSLTFRVAGPTSHVLGRYFFYCTRTARSSIVVITSTRTKIVTTRTGTAITCTRTATVRPTTATAGADRPATARSYTNPGENTTATTRTTTATIRTRTVAARTRTAPTRTSAATTRTRTTYILLVLPY